MRFTGKVAVVTGSGRGIGRAIALRLAEEGAAVVVAALHIDTAEETAGLVEALGGKGLPMKIDVTDRLQVLQMVDRTVEVFGKIDVLVNNAGGSRHYPRAGEKPIDPLARRAPTEDTMEAYWDYVVDLNLKSTFLCSQATIKAMKQQGSGAIVNIASIIGRTAKELNSGPAYAAAKGGVISLTRHMAGELAATGIRVNAVAPGLVATERALRLDPRVGMSLDDHAKLVVPMKRSSKLEEQAAAVAFLASHDASYITGAVLDVNGGWFMG